MNVHEYRVGTWIALVGEGAVALLHPDLGAPAARDLWRLTRSGSRLGTWAEHLAGRGIRTLPSFAMVEAHPAGLSVLVRGDVTVQVGQERVSGAGYTTWRETVLPGGDGFTITTAGASESRAEEWLPVSGGIVLAAALRSPVGLSGGNDDHAGLRLTHEPVEEDPEVTLMQAPALAAAIGRTPAAAVAGADDAPAAQDAPPADGAPAETGEPQPDPAEDAEYDHLFWSTEQLAAEDAERRASELDAVPPAPAAPVPAAQVPAAPAPAGTGPARGRPTTPSHGLEATQVPENEDDLFAPPATDEVVGGAPVRAVRGDTPAPPPPAPVLISEVPWSRPVDEGDHDGRTVLPSRLPQPAADATPLPEAPAGEVSGDEPVLELLLSTGPRVEVDRPVLLGRAPESSRFRGDAVPRLVTVANPQRDISGTHVEVRPAGDHVVVTDMNSTNGTVLVLPGQPSFRLHPGTGVPVPPGGIVELGTGVSVTVVRPGEQPE